MSTNGNTNGHCNGSQQRVDGEMSQWKIGLKNCRNDSKNGGYLTAESFGYKVNASGQGLKKKQTWILETQKLKDEKLVVYLRSSQNRYLSTDKYGKVTCETEASEIDTGVGERFVVEYARDGSGRWAFRNDQHGYYLSGAEESVHCFAKNITDSELWVVQLAIHPQVNIRNVIRKRYAVLCDEEIHCKEVVPWSEAGLIILHFCDERYALKTCDNRFLQRDGSLANELTDDAKFTLEIKPGGLAFRDRNGYYLTATGSTATMKVGKNKQTPSKDEFFTLENTHPQVVIISQNNGKFVSVKQGVDLSANQEEECEKSIFQMEYDKTSTSWAFRTSVDNKYWSLESFGGIQAAHTTLSDKSHFNVESCGDGTVCIKASNGHYLYNKQTGSILCNLENPDSKYFIIRMVHRPFLILKCDFGFVDLKSSTTQTCELVCNKTNYGITFLEPLKDGYYYLKGANNKYWTVADDMTLHADGDKPSCKFLLEFQGQSFLSIKAPNGKYLKGEQNNFIAKGEEIDSNTLWEY